MKAQCAFSSIVFLFLCCGSVFAQNATPPTDIISIQPILHLSNLVPTEVVGFSAQYEHVITDNNSVLGRAMWFRHPFLKQAVFGGERVALSGEFRHYFADGTTGWHLGPLVEWIMFKFLGSAVVVRGTDVKHSVDVGAVAGHKWVTGRISFDLSVRVSWYSPNDYTNDNFFPSHGSQFNSHLMVSIGYGFN